MVLHRRYSVSRTYRHPLKIQTFAKTFDCTIPGSLEATTRFGISTDFALDTLEQRPREGRTGLTGQRQRRFQDLVGVAFHGSILRGSVFAGRGRRERANDEPHRANSLPPWRPQLH
jgi:hypothetical protein